MLLFLIVNRMYDVILGEARRTRNAIVIFSYIFFFFYRCCASLSRVYECGRLSTHDSVRCVRIKINIFARTRRVFFSIVSRKWIFRLRSRCSYPTAAVLSLALSECLVLLRITLKRVHFVVPNVSFFLSPLAKEERFHGSKLVLIVLVHSATL